MKILMATDGSEFSRNAVEEFCKLITTKDHINIKIISAVERVIPISSEPFGASNEYYGQIEADLRKQAKESVAEAEKIINEKLPDANIFISAEVITGNVKQIIIDEAKKFGADMIVVGSHGYGFLERVLIGSISDFVVRHSPCSVLVVRRINNGKS